MTTRAWLYRHLMIKCVRGLREAANLIDSHGPGSFGWELGKLWLKDAQFWYDLAQAVKGDR